MKKHLIAGAIAAAALALLAGCGSDDDTESTSDDTETTEEAGAASSSDGAIVSTGDTELGEVLVDEAGLSLYGFTDDADGVPTCDDACADAWPPVIVDSAELPEGLDAATFSVAERSDGTFQLVAGEWPLYRFAGDAAPGDINGQDSGGTWFLAAPDGSLIRGEDAAATDEAPEAEDANTGGGDYGY